MALPFATNAACFVLGAVLVSRIVLRPSIAETAAGAERASIRADMAEGLRWLLAHPPMRTLALTIFAFNVTFGAAWSVLVLYAQDRLGMGAVGFGLLTTAMAIGGIIGTASYGRLERRFSLGDIMRVGLLIETATHLVLALTTSAAVALVTFVVFGAHAFVWGTTSTVVRQRAVPDALLGRVTGVYTVAVVRRDGHRDADRRPARAASTASRHRSGSASSARRCWSSCCGASSPTSSTQGMWHQLTSIDVVWPSCENAVVDEQQYLTARETAERLGISLRTVRRRIADGSLPSLKIGGAVRIPASALELPAAAHIPKAAREAAVSYGAEATPQEKERYIRAWNRAHWPDFWDRMLERRRQAFAELERLSRLTKPPSGPNDTVDAMLDQVRDEFGQRLLQYLPPAPKDDA